MCPDEHKPQCDLRYETLCCGNIKLAKLHRHLQTNCKEHIITHAKWFHSRQVKQIAVQRLATGHNNENVIFASFEVALLRAKPGKPRRRTEELILPAAGAVASRMLGGTAIGNYKFGFCIRHQCEAKY
jgi:hypothetical protein